MITLKLGYLPEVTFPELFQPDSLVSLDFDFFSSIRAIKTKHLLYFVRNYMISLKIIVLEVYCRIKYRISISHSHSYCSHPFSHLWLCHIKWPCNFFFNCYHIYLTRSPILGNKFPPRRSQFWQMQKKGREIWIDKLLLLCT